MDTITQRNLLTYPSFEIDVAAREVKRSGALQSLQRKPFDLLVYLIEHRDRVVTKSELLERVWDGGIVSESVIARAVMKVRLAIGDASEPAAIIKTVHRVGYRFIESDEGAAKPLSLAMLPPGPPCDEKPRNKKSSKGAVGLSPAVSIALLPVENEIADANCAWVPLGLPSLVARALDGDARFDVVSIETTLSVAASSTVQSSFDRAELVATAVGAELIVHATARQKDGSFCIDYRGFGSRRTGFAGRLIGPDLVGIAQRLSMSIEKHCFPDVDSALCFESSDLLANQAFGRASQAFSEMRFESARKLIDVALDIEPNNTAAMLLRLKIMASVEDVGVLSFGKSILEYASSLQLTRVAANVHGTLAIFYIHNRGNVPETKIHAHTAMELVGEGRTEAWALRVYNINALIASMHGDYGRAIELWESCNRQHKLSGDLFSMATNLENLSGIDASLYDLASARTRLDEALELYRLIGCKWRCISALSRYAGVASQSGHWSLALRRSDEVAALIKEAPPWSLNLFRLTTIASVYAEFGRESIITGTLRHIDISNLDGRGPLHSSLHTVYGFQAAALRQFDTASSWFKKALDFHRGAGSVWHIKRSSNFFLRNEMQVGRLDSALAAATDLSSEQALCDEGGFAVMHMHLQAALLHRDGEVSRAIEMLKDAAKLNVVDRSNAYVRLDLAWLLIERGDATAAKRAVAGISSWLREHPFGMALDARLKFANGDWRAATNAHVSAVDAGLVDSSHLSMLAHLYADGAVRLSSTLPKAPRFLSLLTA